MIYISHLLPDDEMKEIISQTGVGIESIEFSIADNLDHLKESVCSYRERLKFMGCRGLTLHGPFMNIDPANGPSITSAQLNTACPVPHGFTRPSGTS